MADLSDVEDALVTLITAAVYPSGSSSPSALAGAAPAKIFAGWPTANDLDVDLGAGKVNISIFPPPNLERNVSRFFTEFEQVTAPVHTVTTATTDTTVTLTGTASAIPAQYVSLIVNEKAYSYAILANDTLSTIAAALAALVNADTPASAVGAVITIPGAHRLLARVGSTATYIAPVEQMERAFMTTVWASTPALRKSAGVVARAALAAEPRITLADGSAATLKFLRTDDSDAGEKVRCYRRDIVYWVEYAQFISDLAWQVTIPQLNVGPQDFDGVPIPAPKTTFS